MLSTRQRCASTTALLLCLHSSFPHLAPPAFTAVRGRNLRRGQQKADAFADESTFEEREKPEKEGSGCISELFCCAGAASSHAIGDGISTGASGGDDGSIEKSSPLPEDRTTMAAAENCEAPLSGQLSWSGGAGSDNFEQKQGKGSLAPEKTEKSSARDQDGKTATPSTPTRDVVRPNQVDLCDRGQSGSDDDSLLGIRNLCEVEEVVAKAPQASGPINADRERHCDQQSEEATRGRLVDLHQTPECVPDQDNFLAEMPFGNALQLPIEEEEKTDEPAEVAPARAENDRRAEKPIADVESGVRCDQPPVDTEKTESGGSTSCDSEAERSTHEEHEPSTNAVGGGGTNGEAQHLKRDQEVVDPAPDADASGQWPAFRKRRGLIAKFIAIFVMIVAVISPYLSSDAACLANKWIDRSLEGKRFLVEFKHGKKFFPMREGQECALPNYDAVRARRDEKHTESEENEHAKRAPFRRMLKAKRLARYKAAGIDPPAELGAETDSLPLPAPVPGE